MRARLGFWGLALLCACPAFGPGPEPECRENDDCGPGEFCYEYECRVLSHGDPQPGDPLSGDPQPGDPLSGDPQPGDPLSGGPQPGDTQSGDPQPGDTLVGDPQPGDTQGCEPDSVCRAQTCTDGTVELERVCTFERTCPAAGQQSCDGYACNGDDCRITCTSSAHCVTGSVCEVASGTCLADGEPSVLASSIEAVAPACVAADGTTVVDVVVTLIDGDGDPVVGVSPVVNATGTGNTLTVPGATDADGKAYATLTSTVGETKTLGILLPAGLEALTTHVTFSPLYLALDGSSPHAAHTNGGMSIPEVEDDLGQTNATVTRVYRLVNSGTSSVLPNIGIAGGEHYDNDLNLLTGEGADGFRLDDPAGASDCFESGSATVLDAGGECTLSFTFPAGEDGFVAGTYWAELAVTEDGGGCASALVSANATYAWTSDGTTTSTGQDCSSECACDERGKTYRGGSAPGGSYTATARECLPPSADSSCTGFTHCCYIEVFYENSSHTGCSATPGYTTYAGSNNACANCAQTRSCSKPSYYHQYRCE